jgi:hypothetical protein
VVLVGVLALFLRLLFWQATPDSSWPHSALYKGDAPTWVEQARAIGKAQPYEFDLPLRPPGAAYLMAFFWGGGDSIASLKLLWILLGAAVVMLVYHSTARDFGSAVGLVCGLVCAGSSGLMILTASLNNEIPYLVLVAGCLACWKPLVVKPKRSLIVLWAILNAAACLVRVEHILFSFLASAVVAVRWLSDSPRRQVLGRCTLGVVVFVLLLAPWHLQAWRAIERFNTVEHALPPAAETAMQRVEQALTGIGWTGEAERLRARLPAFCRRESASFVAATVAVRGKSRVTAADFGVLEEAFGSIPEPLREWPFVTFYGGLNFYLANNADAGVGFNRAPLERPPPLAGGAHRYPSILVQGLPPADLALSYPPHLEAVNRGWSLGTEWIAEHPREAFGRIFLRLASFWRGTATGIGGANLPLGLSGLRGRADMVAPVTSPLSAAWRLAWLVVAGLGLFIGLRESPLEMTPWLIFLVTKIVAATFFFGYVRHGASAVPVVALFAGLVAIRSADRVRWLRTRRFVPLVVAALLIVLEITRWLLGPQIVIDGRDIAGGDPWPLEQHAERHVTVTW